MSVCPGPVTNAFIMAAPANMFVPDSRPAVPLPRFSRHVQTSEANSGVSEEVCVRLGLYTQVSLWRRILLQYKRAKRPPLGVTVSLHKLIQK